MINYVIKNKVVHGNGLAKKELGFATANVPFFEEIKINLGCYISKIKIDNEFYLGITNICYKNYYISETHILRFDQNLYDKEVEITLLSFMRGPKIANSIKESKSIIESDIRNFWGYPSCKKCNFCIGRDYGYSNWTVEGTDYSCLISEYSNFVPKYSEQNAYICPNYLEGEFWSIDVERESLEPPKELILSMFRDLKLKKLLNE